MRNIQTINNPYGDEKVISACSIFGMMDTSGKVFSGQAVRTAMANMRDRGNGLGGGFAVYGLYPDHEESYALHIMFASPEGKLAVDELLSENFIIAHDEEVSTRKTEGITDEPMVWRYFVSPRPENAGPGEEDDFVVARVLEINFSVEDAFIFSSGKNMAVFKGVGFPEQIYDYFCLEDYEGYIWTAHGRFPTNSQAWWGGAHPFSLLDWAVVHNGEISSYGANRAYLETVGYRCTMQTDTEVMVYAIDLLMRKHKLSPEIFARVVAPPLWEEIDRMDEKDAELHRALRSVYGGLLMNGPFAVVISNNSQMIALTDRIRLRPLTAATNDSVLYISSEEASIRLVSGDLESVWTPMGGVPVVGEIGSLPTKDQSGGVRTVDGKHRPRPSVEVAK